MTFSEWKAKTMARLVELTKKYEDNPKALSDLNFIITKLHYAKSRDLASVLYYMHVVAREIKEILELIPTPSEVEEMLKE